MNHDDTVITVFGATLVLFAAMLDARSIGRAGAALVSLVVHTLAAKRHS